MKTKVNCVAEIYPVGKILFVAWDIQYSTISIVHICFCIFTDYLNEL